MQRANVILFNKINLINRDHISIYVSLFEPGYNTLKVTGSSGSIYTERSHKNIRRQHLIACKIYNS